MTLRFLFFALFLAACSKPGAAEIAAKPAGTPTIPAHLLAAAQATASRQASELDATQTQIALRASLDDMQLRHIATLQAAQAAQVVLQTTQMAAIAEQARAQAAISATIAPVAAQATAQALDSTRQANIDKTNSARQSAAQMAAFAQMWHEASIALLNLGVFVLVALAAIAISFLGVAAYERYSAVVNRNADIAARIERDNALAAAQIESIRARAERRELIGNPEPMSELEAFVRMCIEVDALRGRSPMIPSATKLGKAFGRGMAGGNWQRAIDALAERGLVAKVGDAPNAGYRVVDGDLADLLEAVRR